MIAGDASLPTPMLIVGFDQFNDFYPSLVADNLISQGILAHSISLDIDSLRNRKFVSSMVLARLFDEPGFRQEVIARLKPRLGRAGRIGFPAILGVRRAVQVKTELEAALGIPVFEIPGLPPSIPGMRLQNMLISAIEKCGGLVFNGMEVFGKSSDGNTLTTVYSHTSTRNLAHHAKHFILASGGILGGGITVIHNGYAQDTSLNLPVFLPGPRNEWLNRRFLSGIGHPIFRAGVHVDGSFHPTDQTNTVLFENLFAAGGVLGECDPIRERSLEGIALATAFAVVENLTKAG